MLARARVFWSPLVSLVMVAGVLRPVLAQEQPPAPPAASAAPAPAAPPPAAPSASGEAAPAAVVPMPMPVDSSWPVVTFQPDRPGAKLERWEKGESSGWKTVCDGPCTQAMDRRHGYRVNGDGVVSSPWFKLPKSEDPVTLKTETGSSSVRTAGYILSWAGPIVGAVGLVILAPTNFKENEPEKRSPWDDRTYIGGGMLLGGAVMLLSGLALIGASSTTTSVSRTPPPITSKKPVKFGINGFQF